MKTLLTIQIFTILSFAAMVIFTFIKIKNKISALPPYEIASDENNNQDEPVLGQIIGSDTIQFKPIQEYIDDILKKHGVKIDIDFINFTLEEYYQKATPKIKTKINELMPGYIKAQSSFFDFLKTVIVIASNCSFENYALELIDENQTKVVRIFAYYLINKYLNNDEALTRLSKIVQEMI
jgi:hypothetical protein